MQPTTLSKLLNVSSHTLRRWTGVYSRFLSPGASPTKGKTRQLSEHDMRVLLLIATLRDTGYDLEAIDQRLEKEQSSEWRDLPELPSEWLVSSQDSTVPVEVATSRAYEIAQVAVLRSELDHVTQALQVAQVQVEKLQQDLEQIRAKASVSEQEKYELERRLLEAQAKVQRLEGQISSYSLGREKPINVGLLLLGAMFLGIVLVIVVFAVANLMN